MSKLKSVAIAGSLLLVATFAVADDDIKGPVSAIDAANGTFVVQGITIHTNDRTDYDDGLTGIGDLKEGMRLEVDYETREGRNYAKEVELDN